MPAWDLKKSSPIRSGSSGSLLPRATSKESIALGPERFTTLRVPHQLRHQAARRSQVDNLKTEGVLRAVRVLQRVHSLRPRAQVDLAAKWPRRPPLAVDDRGLLLDVRAAIAGGLAVGEV